VVINNHAFSTPQAVIQGVVIPNPDTISVRMTCAVVFAAALVKLNLVSKARILASELQKKKKKTRMGETEAVMFALWSVVCTLVRAELIARYKKKAPVKASASSTGSAQDKHIRAHWSQLNAYVSKTCKGVDTYRTWALMVSKNCTAMLALLRPATHDCLTPLKGNDDKKGDVTDDKLFQHYHARKCCLGV